MKTILFKVLVLTCLFGYSQSGEVFPGISMGQSLESVHDQLEGQADTIYRIKVAKAVFPLSEHSEDHLICLDYRTASGSIEEVAFTFADDRLSLVQAIGGAVHAITNKRKDTAEIFMDYKVYWDELIVTDSVRDKVWLLSQEAAHPNLYAWDNPYLPAHGGKAVHYVSSAETPDFIEMGGDLKKLKPLLEKASSFTYTRELGPGDPNAQLQIDCFGIEYAGFPRKFEARFGDDKLNMVWILTGKGEEDRIRQKLVHVYGEPIYKNEAWEVFKDWQVFLRKDKPEVLLLTPELGAFYKKDYFKQ